ncbi:MAG: dephospho-CoA kinase [Bacteroidales bacterium]|jgi:dephospho-CoA kinase|nr:dephospho-CoA kinase [Bacteroidales bacterium]
MLKVGLTGSIGSGKSTIAGVFRVLGIPVYVSDDEAKKILDHPDIVDLVVNKFGKDVAGPDGLINRKALATEVFTDAEKLRWLNSVIHPRVREHFSEWIENQTNVSYILQEAAIIYESGFSTFFDKIIVVAAPVEERISRVIKRDTMTRQEVLDRLNKQWPEEKKLEQADYVIFNGDHSQAIPQVLEVHDHLCSISPNYK